MHIKLFYFDLKGRAELIRLILHHAGVEFEDIYVEREEWMKKKPMSSPYGQLPYVEIDGKPYGQSMAIARYFANKFGIAGKTDEEKLLCDAVVTEVDDWHLILRPTYLISIYGGPRNELEAEYSKVNERIQRGLASLEKVLKENNTGYFVGSELTWADIAVADQIAKAILFDNDLLSHHPALATHFTMVLSQPNIKKYNDKRKATPF